MDLKLFNEDYRYNLIRNIAIKIVNTVLLFNSLILLHFSSEFTEVLLQIILEDCVKKNKACSLFLNEKHLK